jgi:hypothetical protein
VWSPSVYQPKKHFITLGGCYNNGPQWENSMKAMVRKPIRIAVAAVIASLLVYCLPGF